MQYVAYFILLFTLFIIIAYVYDFVKTDQNKSLINNLNNYAEKKKTKQQKSEIHGPKSDSDTKNKKKRTRMYHL